MRTPERQPNPAGLSSPGFTIQPQPRQCCNAQMRSMREHHGAEAVLGLQNCSLLLGCLQYGGLEEAQEAVRRAGQDARTEWHDASVIAHKPKTAKSAPAPCRRAAAPPAPPAPPRRRVRGSSSPRPLATGDAAASLVLVRARSRSPARLAAPPPPPRPDPPPRQATPRLLISSCGDMDAAYRLYNVL